MSSSRTKGLSTRLTEAEYATLERAAGAQTLSVWARDVLLQAAAPARSDSPRSAGPRRDDTGGGRVESPAEERAAVSRYAQTYPWRPRVAWRARPRDRWSWDQDRMSSGTLTSSFAWPALILVLACLTGVAIGTSRYTRVWTPLQRQYLPSYVWSAVVITRSGSYQLLTFVDQTGRRTALDADVVPAVSTEGRETFALSATALRRGGAQLAWQRRAWDHAALHAFLQHVVYQDQTLRDLAQPSLWAALAVLVAALVPAVSDQIAWSVIRRAARSRWAP